MSNAAVETRDSERSAESATEEPCIVIATNGSAEADAALRFAAALGAREELALRIVTVLEPLPALPAQPSGAAYHIGIEMERGERILERVRAQLSTTGSQPATSTSMLVGAPAATIADAAREWHARYIVLGAGRHGALDRMLAGDTVVRVLRHAEAPVVAVPSTCGELPRNGIVGLDFGPASLAAANHAATIIGNGVLHVVHVRPEIDIPATDPEGWSEVYEAGARDLLGRYASDLHESHPDVRVVTETLRGHAPTVMLELADRVGADFIAVGQHSRGFVDRFLFGSVASAMVRGAHCAVLIAPPTRTT